MIASNHNPLKFSFIIPAWPEEGRPFGLDFIDRLDWPKENLEVLIARGYSPCKQRNHAARQATGDILIFFDNDSCPEPDYLKQLAKHFADPDVAAVGGPNPGLPTKKFVPNLVEAVLTSRIAVLSKTKRYKATGQVHEGNDSELIFCNFAIRRDLYLQIGGLDERLCPNEENETLERFHEHHPNQKILYDPQLIAYEPRPDTIRAFLRKMYGYGKGRARQCKIRPSAWSFLHLLGCLSFLLPILLAATLGFGSLLVLAVPYVTMLLLQTLTCLIKNPGKKIAPAIAPLTFATHIAYVAGMWKGIFEPKTPRRPQFTVRLECYSLIEKPESISVLTGEPPTYPEEELPCPDKVALQPC